MVKDFSQFPIIILGNKLDLDSKRLVSTSKAESLCKHNENMAFYEVSALDSTNVNLAFDEIAKQALKYQELLYK